MMGFIGPTYLDDDSDAYIRDRHQAKLGINKSPLIFFRLTTLLPRRRSYTSTEIINILLPTAVIVGNYDTVTRYRVYDEEDNEVQHVGCLESSM